MSIVASTLPPSVQTLTAPSKKRQRVSDTASRAKQALAKRHVSAASPDVITAVLNFNVAQRLIQQELAAIQATKASGANSLDKYRVTAQHVQTLSALSSVATSTGVQFAMNA